MAELVNERDVRIMATVPRYSPPTDRGMFLTPSAVVFKVSADGQTASPASVTFKATLLNMGGAVVFTCSDGIAPAIDGNELTLTYANFAAVSGTVTANIEYEGVHYTQVATVAKVADGASGNPGAPGARGNVDISAVTDSNVWSDAQAVAALAAAGYGAPRVRDMVNLYKADRTFSVQKMYNGEQWVTVDYVYHGNMFVKGSILPEAIDTRGLTIRDAEGNIILGAGTGLPPSYAPPGTLNSEVTLTSIGYEGEKNATYTSASRGAALNDDPAIENRDSWTLGTQITVATGAGGQAVASSYLRCAAGTNQYAVTRRRFSLDRLRTYNLTAVLYAEAGNNRDMYLFVNFYDVNGTRLYPSPGWGGSMSGYTYGGLPPTGTWNRQGGNFGAGTTRSIPVGTVSAEVGVWFQYGGTGSGNVVQAAQDVRVVDVTAAFAAQSAADAAALAAAEAQADADTAMGRITSISSDSKLDRSEKPDAERAWAVIDAEHAGLVSQANSLGVSYTDWESRFYELSGYLYNLSGWGNHGVDSDIDRTTYNLRWTNYYTARQALLNAFAAKNKALADAAATTSTWAGTSGRPSDDAIRNNLVDLSWWRRDAAIPWPQNSEFNRIASCGTWAGADVAIAGPRGGSDLVWYAKETAGNGNNGGGWESIAVKIDPNRTYRFVLPICRLSGTAYAYWGTDNVCALNTANATGNPYFASTNALALNRWYLFVGYIYPAGSTGNTSEGAGIWDCTTGEKIVAGDNYCSHAGETTVFIRAYQYYGSPNAEQIFGRPMINLVDGTEPSLREYFAPGAVLNKSITLGADGKLTGAGGGQVTLPGMGQHSFRVVACGNAGSAKVPVAPGLYFNGALYAGGMRSYSLLAIRRSDLAITHNVAYDVYGQGELNGKTAATLAADLNWFADRPGQYILALWTHDEPFTRRGDSGLLGAMYRNGASAAVFGSSQFQYQSAYALIAISGCGEGNGAEAYQGAVGSDPNAWIDVSFTVLNGNIASVSANYTPRSLRDYGFTGDYNATNGATIGANLFGQMNAANISAYIAAAAIDLALINKASIGSLSALTGVIGLLRTGTSGQRSELSDNGLRLFNSANVPVIEIGF